MVFNQTLKQIYEILGNSDNNIRNKIPNKLYSFIYENMDPDYITNLNFNDKNWMNNVSDDAKAFMALIYRDYIVSTTEKNILLKEEQEAAKKAEQLKKEKYNTDNIFKMNNINKIDESEVDKYLITIKEEKWYNKIFSFFRNMFKK